VTANLASKANQMKINLR